MVNNKECPEWITNQMLIGGTSDILRKYGVDLSKLKKEDAENLRKDFQLLADQMAEQIIVRSKLNYLPAFVLSLRNYLDNCSEVAIEIRHLVVKRTDAVLSNFAEPTTTDIARMRAWAARIKS